ncbi:MAG: S-adenosylmethionine:tRNA ribosyltransferase-isomerase [Candidatus Omnitrophota bacterium]|jgi:S-adenosylmethionine:tRNA ribosyltransferase-isomerase
MTDLNERPKQVHSLKDFDFELPKHLIAQSPLKDRDSSKMLILDREKNSFKDTVFKSILDLINPGDVLVLNNTKVFPARLFGKKATGGKIEVLLAERLESDEFVWKTLTKPGLKEGNQVHFENSDIVAEFAGMSPDGYCLLRFNEPALDALTQSQGSMPLPPYIKRVADQSDQENYQTVYAEDEGSIAAPTAGLHFTKPLLEALEEKGVRIEYITLHVGYGTFQPVKDMLTHQMKPERFVLKEATAVAINAAKEAGCQIWAVGSTATRVLETCVMKGKAVAGDGRTDLFITPPFEFEVVDHIITNFHLPESTLLMLVSAFATNDFIKEAYQHAIQKEYRFFSYGDCMVIL